MVRNFLSLVKFTHTVFALPFALLGFVLGVKDLGQDTFPWIGLLKVLLCMVLARNAAMAFNRWADRHHDAQNPRTANREIPSGIVAPGSALAFVVINSLLFIAVAYWINLLCFYLSPVALLVILGYSYTKRFTYLCHLVLGVGLALAPIGAYLATTGVFSLLPVIYSLTVFCWVAGFDIIYALQDTAFDRSQNLHSVPGRFGVDGALSRARLLHIICAVLLVAGALVASTRFSSLVWLHWVGLACFIALLLSQHLLVRNGRLDKINMAFFTTNGLASVVFAAFYLLDLLV